MRRLRKVRGLTQQDLADLLGVSRQTVNAIETGRYDPGLSLAFDVARVFAARMEDVFRPLRPDETTGKWEDVMLSVPDMLEGQGVVLRRHRPADVVPFQHFVTDPVATRYMGFTDNQKTRDGAADLMQMVIASYSTDTPVFSISIADRDTDSYLGAIGAAQSGGGAVEIFVTVMPSAQGRGVARSALGTLIPYLFYHCAAEHLIADIVEQNTRAIALFEGLGFSCQGPIERAAEAGELGNRDMRGLRYTLTARQFRSQP